MWMKEIPAFAQEDFLNDDVYLLDSFDKVYLWIGYDSNKFEKKGAYARAEKYIQEVTDNRIKDEVTICEVEPGKEPPDFTCQFVQWEPELAMKWLEQDPMALLKKEFERAEEIKKAEAEKDPFEGCVNPKDKVFTYAEIKGLFPEGVKGDMKEWYMADAEFETVMGMNKAKYGELKKWKQQDIKKKVGLF
jgi:hypothetical protein